MLLNRRQILKYLSASGGAALSPLLLPCLARAKAIAAGGPNAIPKRFVFVVKSSGLTPAELVPTEMAEGMISQATGPQWPDDLKLSDKLIDVPLADKTLPDSLKSLNPFKDRLTILQGLSGTMCKGGHSSWYGALGCYRCGGEHDTGEAISATIDGELAKAMPSIFTHVGLTLGDKVMDAGIPIKDTMVYPGISAIAKDRPLPFQGSPTLAYQDLFGIASRDPNAHSQQELKSTLLDFMAGDIRRLETKLGSAEKEKLGYYLEAFESLQDRGRKLQGVEAEVRKHAPIVSDKYKSKVETDRLEAHFDIASAALIAGLTNVVTLRVDTLSITYTGLGIKREVHGLGHGEGPEGMSPVVARRRIHEFHLEQIARLAAKLKSVPEGDGTILDNTLIVYTSDAAEKHHSSCVQWPFILVGGTGGKLKTQGRYLQYPGYEHDGQRTIANFYMTLLEAVGQPRERFGLLDLNLDKKIQMGPLPELLA